MLKYHLSEKQIVPVFWSRMATFPQTEICWGSYYPKLGMGFQTIYWIIFVFKYLFGKPQSTTYESHIEDH